MNTYLSPKALTLIVGVPFLLVLAALFSLYKFWLDRSVLSSIVASLPLAGAIVAALFNWCAPMSHAIHIANRLLSTKIPDLNGTWIATQSSNWPRIKARLDGEQLDDMLKTPLDKVEGQLKLHMNLFRIWGTYSVNDANTDRESRTRESDIISASLLDREGRVQLSYIAEARVGNPNPNSDASRYHFAAHLCFNPGSTNEAIGNYSTDRNWAKGLNTAGEMTISRLP